MLQSDDSNSIQNTFTKVKFDDQAKNVIYIKNMQYFDILCHPMTCNCT